MDDSRIAPIDCAFSQDFEVLPLGSIKNITRFVTGGGEGLSVTDKTSAGGRHSLCLTDATTHKSPWLPHIYTRVRCNEGAVRIRFAFNVDTKSQPTFEVRDYYHPAAGAQFSVGPRLSFGNGVVCAAGREIAHVPTGVWCSVEVLLRLSGEQAGTWRCTVVPQGGAPVRVDGLGMSEAFRNLGWVGFMTNGTEPASWYLDDFSIETE